MVRGIIFDSFLREAKPGGFQTGGVSHFFGERSRLRRRPLSGLFLVGALNRLLCKKEEKDKSGKIPGPSQSKSGKSQKNRESPKKDEKGQKRKDQSRSGNLRAATLQKCGSEHFLRFSLPKVS